MEGIIILYGYLRIIQIPRINNLLSYGKIYFDKSYRIY